MGRQAIDEAGQRHGCLTVLQPSTVRFSELPQLDETGINKQWIRYPRKKTVIAGVTGLLKVQGIKSEWQIQADRFKAAFGLPALGVIEVYDEELKQVGCLIPWADNRGNLAQAPWQEWATRENLRRLVQIGVFDGIIGNSDRVVSNVLVLPNWSLLQIDDGEQERFGWNTGRPMLAGKPAKWVKYRKQLLALIATTLKDRQWLDAWLHELPERVKLLPEGTVRQYYRSRLASLDEVVKETLCQIKGT